MDSSNNMNNSNGSKSNQFDHDSANDCDENALEPAAKDLEEAVTAYLRRATETFDLSKNVEVSNYRVPNHKPVFLIWVLWGVEKGYFTLSDYFPKVN